MPLIKLVAIDIDGTLLRPDHSISVATKTAIQACREQGVQVALATGRSWSSLHPYSRELDLSGTMIALNGIVTGDPVANKITARQTFTIEQVQGIGALLDQHQIPFVIFDLDTVYALPGMVAPRMLTPFGEAEARFIPSISAEYLASPVKIVAALPAHPVLPIEGELRKQTEHLATQMRTHEDFIEWVPRGMSKGATLREIMAELGLQREEVLTIGDSQNDVSMFQTSGISVAMGNALANVQQYASHQTASNAEDGVALALQRFVLDQYALVTE